MKDKWEFYKDAEEHWRWRRTSPNGNIIGAATEGYTNKADCRGNAFVTNGRVNRQPYESRTPIMGTAD